MNNMTESNPDRFFENIPETEEATFMFDDASLRVAREITSITFLDPFTDVSQLSASKRKKNTKKILNKCVRKMTVIMDGIDNYGAPYRTKVYLLNST